MRSDFSLKIIRYTDTRNISMGELPTNKREAEPMPDSHLYRRKKTNRKKKRKKTRTLLLFYLTLFTDPRRIQLWSQDRGSYTKTNRERIRSEKTKEHKQLLKEADVKVACKGHRRQKGTQKRAPRSKRQIKRNKQRTTTCNTRKARENILSRLRKKGNRTSRARPPRH